MGSTDAERTNADRSYVDGALLAVLVGGATGWLVAGYGGVTGPDVLGVMVGAAVLLGGMLAVPSLVT